MAGKLQGITAIGIRGFKSIYDLPAISLKNLTILAGANSSGKSSLIQPLLLIKQTLESEYDPVLFYSTVQMSVSQIPNNLLIPTS